MTTYFELQPDIFAKHVPTVASPLGDDINFRSGGFIQSSLSMPLIFSTGHNVQDPPRGFHSRLVPVMSNAFLAALKAAGVTNLQCFPAELHGVAGAAWKDYHAVNVLGLISCADMGASEFTQIMDRPGDGLPLFAFEDLKVDPSRAHGALLFRLSESPGVILVADSVVAVLREQQPDEDWGITLDER